MPGPAPRVANVRPQQFGFSPGASLIGNFGSTEPRFRASVPNQHNPGPGEYTPKSIGSFGTSGKRYGWGSALAHDGAQTASKTPGPDAYNPTVDTLKRLEKQWPGRTSASAFGSNASREKPRRAGSTHVGVPGPGRYNVEECSHFISGPSGASGAHSPFVGAARARTGSRLRRDLDNKETSAFASGSVVSGGGTQSAADGDGGVGPGHYAPVGDTIGGRAGAMARRIQTVGARASDGRHWTAFDSTSSRWARDPMSGGPDPNIPGPGAHSVPRWTGQVRTFRKPIRDHLKATDRHKCAFLSGSARFVFPHPNGDADTDAVISYLSSGSAGPVGTAAHTQSALGAVGSALGGGATGRADRRRGGTRRVEW